MWDINLQYRDNINLKVLFLKRWFSLSGVRKFRKTFENSLAWFLLGHDANEPECLFTIRFEEVAHDHSFL